MITTTKPRFADYLEMTKPRICVMALLMSFLGYYLGMHGAPIQGGALLIAFLGIGLVGASSCVLNQYIERAYDGLMWRTLKRPIPAGRVTPEQALKFGSVLGIVGMAILLIGVNPVTAVLGALTVLFYLGIYTPAKRVNSLSTLVGAIPGAMPPLLGWTAATQSLDKQGLLLFGILFIWQIPHFLGIAWLYREDYRRGDFPILTVVDPEGRSTCKQILVYTLVLIPLTLVPTAWGMAGSLYFYGALLLGFAFLFEGIQLYRARTLENARRLFYVSLIYLPGLSFLMAWDRI